MKIGLFGDSFGYELHDQPYPSWVTLLKNNFEIINHCQSGVSEYKILQQLKKSNLESFDKILITHTSPLRVYVAHNPLHTNSNSHKNCDIIFTDIADRTDDFSMACQQYFRYIFDIDYATNIHNMICQQIDQLCQNKSVLHITHFDYTGLFKFCPMLNFYQFWLKNKGEVNHYNQTGNQKVYKEVLNYLNANRPDNLTQQ